MVYIKKKKGWEIPRSETTPEDVYMTRRGFFKSMGLATAFLLTSLDELNAMSGRPAPPGPPGPPGPPVAVIGSSGFLEIASPGARAEEALGSGVGEEVEIRVIER